MKHLSALLLVALGGSIGSMSRYLFTLFLQPMFGSFPLSTMIINMGGCLVIGVLTGLIDASINLPPSARLFLITGFCGGFTTMSSFIYEINQLARDGQSAQAVLYLGGTLVGSFALFIVGHFSIKLLFR